MGDVYWLEQTAAEMPVDDSWLGPREICCLAAMRFEKRRGDWRLGRWTAKLAISAHLNLPSDVRALRTIEIRATESGAPEALIHDHPSSVMISISHCNGTALCAVTIKGAEMGCDLEVVEVRSDSFLMDYFTREEQLLVSRASVEERPLMSSLLWSAKESALKALRTGLRMDTRSVIVKPQIVGAEVDGWRRLDICCAGEGLSGVRLFQGWWRYANTCVRTIVAEAAPSPPIEMRVAKRVSEKSASRTYLER